MMKTYWILDRKQNLSSKDEPLNPIQKNKLHSTISSANVNTGGRKTRVESTADLCDAMESTLRNSNQYSPPLPRAKDYLTYDHTPKLPHILNTPRPSLSPDAWPALENSMQGRNNQDELDDVLTKLNSRLSNTSMLQGVLNSHRGESIDLGDSRYSSTASLPPQFNITDDLKILASQNAASIKEFERVAEENARTARQLANWAHYVAGFVSTQKQTTSSSGKDMQNATPTTGRRATVANVETTHSDIITAIKDNAPQKKISYSNPLLGSSVDIEDSKSHKDGNCLIL